MPDQGHILTPEQYRQTYATDEACRRWILNRRWPDGFRCPKCGHGEYLASREGLLYQCKACGHKVLLVNKRIARSPIPLRKWFLAEHLFLHDEREMTPALFREELQVQAAEARRMLYMLRHSRRHIPFRLAAAWLRGEARIPHRPKGQRLDLSRFELTWSDEFEGDSLDRNTWPGHLHGQANFSEGVQKRRDGYWCLDMAKVEGGMLHIPTAYYPEGMSGGPPGWYALGIDTRQSFRQKYGYFEARCKLPKGKGLWAAFWMFAEGVSRVDGSGRSGTEIDIFESPYHRRHLPLFKNAVSTNLHYDGYGRDHRMRNVGKFRVEDPYDSFHTYGMEWNEREYIFYIDGVEAGRSSFGGVSQTEQFLILSAEHNQGGFDGWPGDIRKNKPGEITDFVIDYVRAYQYKI